MDVDVVSLIAQALADRTRVCVLDAVDGRLAVGEIAVRLNVTSATATYHLRLLAGAGIVELTWRGRRHIPRRVPDAGLRLVRALG